MFLLKIKLWNIYYFISIQYIIKYHTFNCSIKICRYASASVSFLSKSWTLGTNPESKPPGGDGMEAGRESHSCPRPGQAAGSLGTQGWEPAPLPDPPGLLTPQVAPKKAIRQGPRPLCLQGREPRAASEHPSLPPLRRITDAEQLVPFYFLNSTTQYVRS